LRAIDVVFRPFNRFEDRAGTAGDQTLDNLWGDAKGGGALGSVEYPKATAGARAKIKESTSLGDLLRNEVYRLRYRGELLGNGLRD
jgi:hypothetical protein